MVPCRGPAGARWAGDPAAPGDAAAGEGGGRTSPLASGPTAPARGSLPALWGARHLKGTEAPPPRPCPGRAPQAEVPPRAFGICPPEPTGGSALPPSERLTAELSRGWREGEICGGGGRMKIVCTV